MKINLEKACIGFLVGILIYCVCNKKFLIEGLTGPVNTCRELSPATCDEEKLCYVEEDKVCSANDQKQCEGEGFRWCGTGGKVETCDGTLEDLCGAARADDVFECAKCAGDNQQALKSAGCSNDNISAWCAGVPSPGPPGPDKCNDVQYWKGGCQDTGEPSNGWSQDMKDKIIVNNQLNESITFELSQDGKPFTGRITVENNEKKINEFPDRFKDKSPGVAAPGGRITFYNGSGKELGFAEFSGGSYGGVNISYVDRLSYPIKVKTCNEKYRGCCFENIEKYNEYNRDCCPFGQSNDTNFVGCLSQRDYCLTKQTDPNYEKYCGTNSHLTAEEVGCPNAGDKSNTAFDIWGCLPAGNYSGETVGKLGKTQAQCCAALNRGVDYLDAGQYDQAGNDTHIIKPTSKFYKRSDEKYNVYSKMVHEICPGGASPNENCGGNPCGIFGFSHDDVNKSGGFMGFDTEENTDVCGNIGGFEIVIG